MAAVAEGALLGAYSYARYNKTTRQGARRSSIQIITKHPRDRATKEAVARASVVAAAVHGTRDLVHTAPNDLYPAAFADPGQGALP